MANSSSSDRGTVLHEIQSLERQLDRLLPTIEKYNQRISTIEADIRNIRERLDKLHCGEYGADIHQLKIDLAILQRDLDELDKETDGIQKDRMKTQSVWSGRLWGIFEKLLVAAIGGGVGFLVAQLVAHGGP